MIFLKIKKIIRNFSKNILTLLINSNILAIDTKNQQSGGNQVGDLQSNKRRSTKQGRYSDMGSQSNELLGQVLEYDEPKNERNIKWEEGTCRR